MGQPAYLSKLKWCVESAGGEWVGVQETVPPMLPLLMFNSKNSKSTLAVSFNPINFDDDVLVAAIQQRIGESDKKFRRRK